MPERTHNTRAERRAVGVSERERERERERQRRRYYLSARTRARANGHSRARRRGTILWDVDGRVEGTEDQGAGGRYGIYMPCTVHLGLVFARRRITYFTHECECGCGVAVERACFGREVAVGHGGTRL